MHELYIAESILNCVKDLLPANVRPSSVKRIDVRVGRLDAVVPESLNFMFDAIKAAHGMSQAGLRIRCISVRCRCGDCRREFSIELPIFICPDCGGKRVDVLRGRGITVRKIIVEDSDEKSN